MFKKANLVISSVAYILAMAWLYRVTVESGSPKLLAVVNYLLFGGYGASHIIDAVNELGEE